MHGDLNQSHRFYCPAGCAEKTAANRERALLAWNTRTDVTDARIKELERALRRIKGWAVGASGQTAAETYMRAIACETLKGEDK
jgi:hypothetical protein